MIAKKHSPVLIISVFICIWLFCGDPTNPFNVPPTIENGKAILTSGNPELDSAYFMYIEVSGSESLIYQWYKNNTAVPSGTSDTLKFAALSYSDTGFYHCIVENDYGSDTSLTDTLRIIIPDDSPPIILNGKAVLASGTQQLDSLYIIYIQAVGGGTLTYQWYKNNAIVTNAMNYSLVFSALMLSDTGVYHCIVTNTFGADTSLTNTITITISDNTPPQILNGKAVQTSGTLKLDSLFYLYVDAVGSDTLIFQWYKNDTIITRLKSDSLKFEPLGHADTGVYRCIVSNAFGEDTSLSYTLVVISDSTPPVILNDKQILTSGTSALDSAFLLYISAVGSDTLKYQWYKDGKALAGKISDTLTFSTLALTDTGLYHCVVTNEFGSDTSNKFDLRLSNTNPEYTVTFDSQGGSAVSSQTVDSGGFATEPVAPTYAGYTFVGWFKESACTNAWLFSSDMVTSDVTLYAKWKPIPVYTVTFDSQGGSAVSSQTVDSGGLVTEPVPPTYAGYTFVGWFKESACTNAWLFSSDMVTSDVTLYAKWSTNPVYTVTFNSQGGSTVASQSVDSGGFATEPGDPTRDGYTFGGWFKESACTNAWIFTSEEITSNVTIFAKWTAVIYTITYHLDGGTNSSGNPDTYTIESPLITLENPSKSGFIFEGWYSDPGFTTQVTEIPTGSTDNIDLYAKWGWSYTVTFDGQGATTDPDPTSITVTSPATTVGSLPTDPIKTGYTFGGWFTEINGGGTAFTAFTTVTEDITVFAKWTINTFTVNFDSHGGSDVDPYTDVPYNSTIAAPTPPTLSLYTFMGWYKDQACTDDWDFDNDHVTSTITLHAKWEKTTYVLTVIVSPESYGTVIPASGTVFDAGTVVGLTATSTNENHYAFSNWTGDASGNNSSTTVTMDKDRTVTANFTELPNNAPIVEELVMNFTYVTLSTESQFTFKVRDNDGDVMHWEMQYESDDGGVVTYTPASGDIISSGEQYCTVIGVALGTFTPKLVVSDDYGGSTIETSNTRAILDMK